MSACCTATFDGESFEVEISSDGELTIVDHDIEYDIAFIAMGGDKTPAVRLLDAWQGDPTDVICYYLGLDENILRLLAADWAEHVLPVFECEYPRDKRPREAVMAVRDFVAGKITAAQLEEARESAWAATGSAAGSAARAAAASWAAAAEWAAKWARAAAADPTQEQSWQVRHFVHVMENLQAGKKWPGIAETP